MFLHFPDFFADLDKLFKLEVLPIPYQPKNIWFHIRIKKVFLVYILAIS